MTSKAQRWMTFTKERFPLLDHSLMIILFVGAHLSLSIHLKNDFSIFNSFLTLIAIFFFFYKMRLYDEIKDYDLDCQINPDRPLPRGLLEVKDMHKGIVVCIFFEIALFLPLRLNAIMMMIFAICYSLLMYKEFFIPKLIRPHLTTYALLHTVVTIPMGIAIFTAATSMDPRELNQKYLYFVLCSWFVFNIFEFGRKTFTTEEERNAVESYSKIFTRFGAVILVVSMSLFSLLALRGVFGSISILQSILTLVLFLAGILFAVTDAKKFGKLYRIFSSIYIILFYIFFIIETQTGLLL
ncbi:UbiA family prenyltransferase [Halobacteriovorax sp. HLS]|uniref:UbiA family prenyltransferase n=1 Tax=Halobacteriovorax sp. HLS TaxID=2234000 RepID=UPI000FD795F9|nr:UbiA family prenyltransferase [Halobacteriovorax sp. HLS]